MRFVLRDRRVMRSGAFLTVALLLIATFGLQGLLLRSLLGYGTLEATDSEELLDKQLQRLRNSTLLLDELHLRLEAKLTEFVASREDQPVNGALREKETTQQGHELERRLEAARQRRAEATDALQTRTVRLADLSEAIERQSRAAAELTIVGADRREYPTHDSQGEQLIFPPGNEEGQCVAGVQKASRQAVAAVVTVTFDRQDYLKRHLDSLLAVHSRDPNNKSTFPLHVSQDGKVPKQAVANLAKSFGSEGVRYLHHQEWEAPTKLLDAKENLAYYRIANHYKFILRTFFDCFGYSKLIILEDDMELAPDFFSYFEATGRLLSTDPSLFCVSSWNDHGQAQFVSDETRLSRSDFFPGLGWMLSKELWLEVREEWPKAYWDDWMRLNKVRRERQCLRPEVCRTYNFGAKGSSRGFYYKRFLAPIRLSAAEIDWSKMDLSYLQQPRYDLDLNATLGAAQRAFTVDEAKDMSGEVVLWYDSQEHYEALTGRLGMLREWKDGVPRGGYRGVVTVNWNGARVHLAPSTKFVQPAERTGATARVDATGALVRKKTVGRKFGTERRR